MGFTDALKSLFGSGTNRTIGFDDLKREAAAKTVVVVDVREPAEFASGAVPGAINLPLSTFNPAQLPEDKPVVLICLAGGRSARALGQAVAAGREDICHFAGGMNGWRQAGGPVA